MDRGSVTKRCSLGGFYGIFRSSRIWFLCHVAVHCEHWRGKLLLSAVGLAGQAATGSAITGDVPASTFRRIMP